MKQKRGQITIFVIIAILIISTLMISLILINNESQKKIQQEDQKIRFENKQINDFYQDISKCLNDQTKEIMSKVGNQKELIETYLSVNGENCFNQEQHKNLEVLINPSFSLIIFERKNNFLIDIHLNTQIKNNEQTAIFEKFSFTIDKKIINKQKKDFEFIDNKEIFFISDELNKEQKQNFEEIIIEYNYIPQDLFEFEKALSNITILERRFLFSEEELQELIYDESIHEIIINHSFDEFIRYNSTNINFKEINSILSKFDFVKSVNENSKYKLLEYREIYTLNQDKTKLNDKLFDYQWYLENKGQFFGKKGADINILEAWQITKGNQDTIISVIDQGVFQNKDYNEKVIYEKSFNFVDNNKNVIPTRNYEYHASHVIGIIASDINNDYGIAGICPNCKIINYKVADSQGHINSEDITKAILKSVSEGVKVISLSLGGEKYSAFENSLYTRLSNQGIIFIAAAGNDAKSQINYPAGYTGVISVGATNNLDKKAEFSNYGNWVDIYAPGHMIISACGKDKFCMNSGTSMATPIVTGVIGLMLSIKPELKPNEILKILKETGQKLDGGITRVNAGKAINKLIETTQETTEQEILKEELKNSKIQEILIQIKQKRNEILKNRQEIINNLNSNN